MSELQDMLVTQLRDAFSAEKQAIQGMKRSLRNISAPELKEGTQAHIEQSEEQRERVEQALRQLGTGERGVGDLQLLPEMVLHRGGLRRRLHHRRHRYRC